MATARLVTSTEFVPFPVGDRTIDVTIEQRHVLEAAAEQESNIIFAFDKKFPHEKPDTRFIATVGSQVSVTKFPKNKESISLNLAQRVRIVNIKSESSGYTCEFEPWPEEGGDNDAVAAKLKAVQGIFAELLRRHKVGSTTPLWKEALFEKDPRVFIGNSLEWIREVVKSEQIQRFSRFAAQQLLSVEGFIDQLEWLEFNLCTYLGLKPNNPSCSYEKIFEKSGKSTEDKNFGFSCVLKPKGEIDSDGTIVIGCPSGFPGSVLKNGCIEIPAEKGTWNVFHTIVPDSTLIPDREKSGDKDEGKADFTWNAIIITREAPHDSWLSRIANAESTRIEVESGSILAVPRGICDDEAIYGGDLFYDSVNELETEKGDVKFYAGQTSGDGGFPVRVITDEKGNLVMAIILIETF